MTLDKEELLEFKTNDKNELFYIGIDDFMDYICQNNLYEYTEDIYNDDGMNDIVRYELDNYGWDRVRYMLRGIDNMNCNYFFRNTYGNFRNITNIDINSIIDNIVKNLDNSYKEDYEL